ncbi:hypothetical protein LCGC14_1615840, partial [marine sediment metagenome]
MMSRKMKVLLVVGGCLLTLIAFVYFRGWDGEEVKRDSIATVQELAKHPIYGKYSFGETDKVIDVGMQPLGLTISLISEAMKRDAILKAALAGQGLEIRFHPFFKGTESNFFLARGDLDVVLAGDMPTLTAASVYGITVGAQNRVGLNSIVAKRPLLIKELEGKRIGYAFGSTAHHNILQALHTEGLREADVRLIQLKVSDLPDALDHGEIDAFAAWEPTPTIALAKFDDFVIIHRGLASTYLYFSNTFADRYPKAVHQIVASQLRTINWLKRQKSNLRMACSWAMQAGKDFTGRDMVLSMEQYASLIERDLLTVENVSIIPRQDLETDGRLFRVP